MLTGGQNDCALTRRESDNQLFLLQTVPGIIFRFRQNVQGRTAALSYFQNVLEAQTTGEGPHKETIRQLLGNDYSSLFEHSLRVIPSYQFVHVSWNTPWQGGNGTVFVATWRKSVAQKEQHVEVVIKRVFRLWQHEYEMNSLKKEVRVSMVQVRRKILNNTAESYIHRSSRECGRLHRFPRYYFLCLR
jgi:hypothetical protein